MELALPLLSLLLGHRELLSLPVISSPSILTSSSHLQERIPSRIQGTCPFLPNPSGALWSDPAAPSLSRADGILPWDEQGVPDPPPNLLLSTVPRQPLWLSGNDCPVIREGGCSLGHQGTSFLSIWHLSEQNKASATPQEFQKLLQPLPMHISAVRLLRRGIPAWHIPSVGSGRTSRDKGVAGTVLVLAASLES